jgi:hypothetical protein
MTCTAIAAAIMLIMPLAIVPAIAQEAPPVWQAHDEPGLLPEPSWLTTGMDFAGRFSDGRRSDRQMKEGFYPQFGGLYTGAGWLAVGGGYRMPVFDDRALFDGSAMVSWRGYKQLQGRFLIPRLAGGHVSVGTEGTWRDLMQVNYFGIGADSLEANRSEYRVKTFDAVGFADYRPARWLIFEGRAGYLARPTLAAPTGPNDRGFPDARVTFVDEPAFALDRQPGFVHGGVAVTADTRDSAGHPLRGGLYRAAWTAYSDRELETYTFHRYEAEGLQVLPIAAEQFTIVLHAWTVASDTASNQIVPVYMLPSLGGSNTLRAFADFRFHDRNLLLTSVESRIALFTHIDLALFADAGNVAPRFADLDLAKRSYGAGFRFHTHQATTARIDLAKGTEGWRLMFSLNDPFKLGRVSKTVMAVPFVP